MKDTYILEKTITTENCTVRIWRPELTEEERNRRMNQIGLAAENLLKSAMVRV